MNRSFYAIAVLAIVAYPFIYIGNYAGDSQVHLIYGQNAAQGAFFEFNLGEKSPGVTSPGYMLLIAGFFKIAPDTWVPAMIKVINLFFWYGLIAIVFMAAKTLSRSVVWATIAALAIGLLPGSVYNSTNGMENGIFAFCIAVWTLIAMRAGWFKADGSWRSSYKTESTLGILLGVACWLRPEGFVVTGIALGFRLLLAIGHKRIFISSITRSTAFMFPFIVFAGMLVYFHWSQTGHMIPTSGSSRILMSNLAPDTFKIGSVFFTPKMAIRLAQYFSLTLPSFLAIWLTLRGSASLKGSREIIGFLIILFWTFFVLYGFVFGSVHLSRYITFIMPGLVLLAVVGGKWLWDSCNWSDRPKVKYVPALTAVAIIVALLGVYSVETHLRIKLDSQSSLWQSMQAPLERKAFSDELFKQLGKPETLPVSVALQEVQARYWLDERFIVRSLDGRIDPVLMNYADRGGVDHIGYLEARGVQFLLDTPNYNRDSQMWSLDRLGSLQAGENVSRDGVVFLRMDIDRSGLKKTSQAESGQWRWFRGEDGITKLHALLVDLIRVEYAGS